MHRSVGLDSQLTWQPDGACIGFRHWQGDSGNSHPRPPICDNICPPLVECEGPAAGVVMRRVLHHARSGMPSQHGHGRFGSTAPATAYEPVVQLPRGESTRMSVGIGCPLRPSRLCWDWPTQRAPYRGSCAGDLALRLVLLTGLPSPAVAASHDSVLMSLQMNVIGTMLPPRQEPTGC